MRKETAETPRVKFCWNCGRKLRGRHFAVLTIDGHERTLHKLCAELPQVVARDDEMPAKRTTLRSGGRSTSRQG